MLTISNIETQARFFSGDESIVLTVDPGKSILNEAYRKAVTMNKYAEFRFKTRLDFTTSGTGSYTWDIKNLIDCGSSSTTATVTIDCGTSSTTSTRDIDCGFSDTVYTFAVFDVVAIEVETGNGTGVMEFVFQPDSEDIWSEVARDANGQPFYWVRNNTSGNVVEFRPIPNFSSGEIRVTGYDKPDEIEESTEQTRFLNKGIDDAIARLVAAEYADREKAELHTNYASDILQKLSDDIFVIESKRTPVTKKVKNKTSLLDSNSFLKESKRMPRNNNGKNFKRN